MKILMLLDRQFPPDVRVENEAESLIKEGHDVHILSYAFKSIPFTQTINSINIHRFRISEQLAKKSLGLIHIFPIFKYIWRRELKKMLNHFEFDIIHIHDLPLCFLIPYLKSRDFKVIADMHENYPYLVEEQRYVKFFPGKLIFSSRKWFKAEKDWLSKADHIVVVAEEMKARLRKLLPSNSSFVVVPNTLNLSLLSSQREELPNSLVTILKDRFIITYVGGFDEVRGIHLMLMAAKILLPRIPELMVLLVGDGSYRRNIEVLSDTLDLDSHVHITGWVSASKVIPLIELSHVCVIPHLKNDQTDNSSPNKLFQYMYCKKPVVSSNCRSLEKIIKENDCGLIFENNIAKDLAEKILSLYIDQEQRETLGRNGFKTVIERFNWEIGVKALIEVLAIKNS